MPCPWQLYLFSLVNIAAGVLCCFDFVCDWAFGECTATIEHVMVRAFAISMLYVGALFQVLTFINHKNPPKTKRLAMIATQCTVAFLAGIIMTGPKQNGGVEQGWAHWGDMGSMAVLLIIMWTAIYDEEEVAKFNNMFTGFGINCKTLLWIIFVLTIAKMFFITDVIPYGYMVNDEDAVSSEIARTLWNFMAIFILEIVLVLFYAIGYGDEKDHEATVMTIVVMAIVSGFAMIGTHWKHGLVRQWIITLVICILIAGGAIVGGRRNRVASAGYTEVANV